MAGKPGLPRVDLSKGGYRKFKLVMVLACNGWDPFCRLFHVGAMGKSGSSNEARMRDQGL